MRANIPTINRQFVCIVDFRKPELAAIISSYLNKKGVYFPILEFPHVTCAKPKYEEDKQTENSLSIGRATHFATLANNILARITSCDYLILAGLSVEQKSYLYFLSKTNVIDISDMSEVDFYLSSFISEAKELLLCRPSDVFVGLSLALRSNFILKIDERAEPIQTSPIGNGGLIIIENDNSVTPVIAVNYAYSINSDVHIVEPLDPDDRFIIHSCIEGWRNGDLSQYKHIEQKVTDRIGAISFSKIDFATFFTTGLPYSLVLNNCIPCSYVHLELRADFFILDNLIYEKKNQYGGAVCFSPGFFKDEETAAVSTILNKNNFYVRELFGKNASVYNLDMNLKEFPYDIFHLCSHGGEIEGRTIEETFVDSKGDKHTVVYDEVLSISPSSKAGYGHVQRKTYFKKFDGLVWRSPELKSKYPHYVFSDMMNALDISTMQQKKVLDKKKKIPNSSAIHCSDGNHQGMLNILASHSSPFIFNNTCWSWYQIAEQFLVSGARGYIGTLWNIQNSSAVNFSTEFYRNIFSDTILQSFHRATKSLESSNDNNIYIFWGLHFSTMSIQLNLTESRGNVFEQLMRSYYIWSDKLERELSQKTKDLITELVTWIKNEMQTNFNTLDLYLLKQKVLNRKKRTE